MATYSELILLPYCRENWQLAAERVGDWLRTSGTIMRVAEKGPQSVRLRGTTGMFPVSATVTFVLRFSEQGVAFEGWVENGLRYSIKPGWADKGVIAVAWAEYQSLVRALKGQSDSSSSLGP